MIKIKKISVYLLRLKLRFPFTTAFGTYDRLLHPFVVIETKNNLTGIGEIPTLTDPAYKPESDVYSVMTSLKKFILPSLIKYQKEHHGFKNIKMVKKSYSWIKGANFAKSGIESAFWNLLAQQKKQPLWKLWKGRQKEFIVGVSIGGKTEKDVIQKAEKAISQGYKRLKVKVWPGVEEKFVKLLRKRYPKIMLQVDANSSYSLKNWKLLKKLDQYNLLLIEQPLYDDDIVFHSEISKKLKTPICLDESIRSLIDVKKAIMLWEKNKIPKRLIINIKPPRVGGFDEAIRIIKYCSFKKIKTWIGGMLETGWGKAFNLNLNALKEVSLPGDHFSPTGSYFEKNIITRPLLSREGKYKLTNKISTGVKINKKVFKLLTKKVFIINF